jgi:hypothetical protein
MRSGNMKKSGLDGTGGVAWISSGDLLTTGTRTLDTQPFGYACFLNSTIGTNGQQDLYNVRDFGEHPIVLQTSGEGMCNWIVIQTPIGNAQAAGVSKYAVQLEWAEVAQY